jgi:peptidoglycan/LPS O-acetylase OafA/YrhL
MKIANKWLLWMGVNLFPLYIYQRIPMIAMSETLGNDFIKNYTIVYVIACLAVTVLIAKFYKYWQIKLK